MDFIEIVNQRTKLSTKELTKCKTSNSVLTEPCNNNFNNIVNPQLIGDNFCQSLILQYD